MKRGEFASRLNRFMLGFKIRKGVCICITLAAAICGTLGAFYFQLLLENDLCVLIAWLGIILSAVCTFISILLSRKDTYKQWLMTTYAAKMETKQFKGTGDFVKTVADAIKEQVPNGISGFKYACKENKLLLNSMLASDCAAFPEYNNKGIMTKLNGFLLKFAASDFQYFALMDCILNNGNNTSYRILSSTRWYPIYKRYTKKPLNWLMCTVLPWIVGLIGSNIACNILDSMFDFNSAILMLIQFGILCVVAQLVMFKGKFDALKKMAFDFEGEHETPVVPAANFDICMAFANISEYYRTACIEAGFIQQPTSKQDIDGQLINTNG